MISSSSRRPGRPLRASAPRTDSTIPPRVNCTTEMLIATRTGSGQSIASRQAVSSTKSPIGTISPVLSATGMNVSGLTLPSSSSSQRSSASQQSVRRLPLSTSGW